MRVTHVRICVHVKVIVEVEHLRIDIVVTNKYICRSFTRDLYM